MTTNKISQNSYKSKHYNCWTTNVKKFLLNIKMRYSKYLISKDNLHITFSLFNYKKVDFCINKIIGLLCCFLSLFIAIENLQVIEKYIFGLVERKPLLFNFLCNEKILTILLTIGTIYYFICFLIFSYIYYIIISKYFSCFIKKISTHEKNIFYVIYCLFIFLIIVAYINSNVFYHPLIPWDIIYTSDTGILYQKNAWLLLNHTENDIRQPLFALFSAPICVFPYIISKLLFFIPNIHAYLLAIIQAFLVLFSLYTLSFIVIEKNIFERILFFLLLVTTFPTLLFILNMEQYSFALFWLIIFMNIIVNRRFFKIFPQNWISFFFLAAAGSIITSWTLAVAFLKHNDICNFIKTFIKKLIYFVLLLLIFLRFGIIFTCIRQLRFLLRFTSLPGENENTIIQNFYQFSNFTYSCIFAPASYVINETYQLCNSENINIIGCILFFIAIIGFIINRKMEIAHFAFIWVLLSILLLLVFGYGAKENGMVLYTLYFSWAYYILIFLAISRFISIKKFQYIAMIFTIILQFFINIPAMMKIIEFGIKYYPNR